MVPVQRCYTLLCLLLITASTLALPKRVARTPELTPSRCLIAPRARSLDVDDIEVFRRQDVSLLQPVVPVPSQQIQDMTSTSSAASSTGMNPLPGSIPNDSATSPDVDCRNLATGRDNKCWNELKLTDWVNNWVANNSRNCTQGEAFASCFLRLNEFYAMDCTGIKQDTCVPPVSPYFKGNPELFYVTYNIYAINQFFNSWWRAVGDAGSLASNNVDMIEQIVNPPEDTNVLINKILIALTGIFSVAPIAASAARDSLQLSVGILTASQIVESVLWNAPQVGRYFFPKGNPEATFIQLAELKDKMVELVQQVQSNLNDLLVETMTNTTIFLAFASQGNFTHEPPSLADQANYLLYSFNTYIVSRALAGNDVHAVVARDTNPLDLATNGTELNYDIGCSAFNDQGVCGAWWYSKNLNMAFGLNDFSHMNHDWSGAISKLLAEYTTGELLFENALTCSSQGGFDGAVDVNVTVTADGVGTACLSQLQVLTWDMMCADHDDDMCEFIEAPAQNTFLSDCGSHSAYDAMGDEELCVPWAYMGPLLKQKKMKLIRD